MKNKLIRIFTAVCIIFLMTKNVVNINAANGVTISSNKRTLNVGETATITVRTDSMHVFDGSASAKGAGSGSANIDGMFTGESRTFQVKATAPGTITVTVSGRSSNLNDPEKLLNASASVNITVLGGGSSGGGGSSKPQVPNVPKEPVEVKSRDNTLKSLSISEGTLSPEFSKDVKEYSVLLPKSVTSIDVSAVVNDDKSKVSNTGKHELKVGENVISLIVTPEEGSEGLYKINVYVEDDPKHVINLDDNDYSVIEHFVGAKIPDSFSEVELNHKGEKVVGLYSELWKTNLLYLNDSENNRKFYIVEESDDGLKIVSPFQLISIYSNDFLLLDVPAIDRVKLNMVYEDVQIGDQTFKGFKYSDDSLKNYSVIYVRNMEGEDVYYQYEENDDVYQLYVPNIAVSEDEYNAIVAGYDEKINFMTIGLIAVSSLLLITGISFALYSKKTKKQLRHLIIRSEHDDFY